MSDSRIVIEPSAPISREKIELLESLTNSDDKPWAARFSKEDDAILLKYWTVKKKADVARIIGYSQNTCRKRYRELTGGENG